MGLSTGLRPRSQQERLAVAALLHKAPLHLSVPPSDDGWLAAQLWIAGRIPHWPHPGGEAVDAALQRLGLPPLDRSPCAASVDASFRLRGATAAESRPLPRLQGKPTVSLLICTYNRAELLPAAVASARAQDWPCEIVVVNDGSQDETRSWLETQDDLVVLHQENQGKPTALNAAINAASGDALLVLDDDDLLLPGAIRLLATALFSHPELSMVFGDSVVFDGATGEPGDWLPASRVPPARCVEECVQRIPGMPGACLIRASAQAQAGPYDPSMVRGQDMDMYLRLSQVAPFASLPFATFLYRSHDGLRGSAAGQWRKSDQSTHTARFRSFVQPVFTRRLEAVRATLSPDQAHSWALGAQQRGLPELGRSLIVDLAGGHSPRQRWIRQQLGLVSQDAQPTQDLLLLHDGDEGALEAALQTHAWSDGEQGEEREPRGLWVHLHQPADPLSAVRLYWEGNFGAGEDLRGWIQASGPIHVRLSSAPAWSPPPLPDAGFLLPGDARVSVYATALAMGWPLPKRTRPGMAPPANPLLGRLVRARRSELGGQHAEAFGALEPLLAKLPDWKAGWVFAQRLMTALGLQEQAAQCGARAL